jgi:hypothetical protein
MVHRFFVVDVPYSIVESVSNRFAGELAQISLSMKVHAIPESCAVDVVSAVIMAQTSPRTRAVFALPTSTSTC